MMPDTRWSQHLGRTRVCARHWVGVAFLKHMFAVKPLKCHFAMALIPFVLLAGSGCASYFRGTETPLPAASKDDDTFFYTGEVIYSKGDPNADFH